MGTRMIKHLGFGAPYCFGEPHMNRMLSVQDTVVYTIKEYIYIYNDIILLYIHFFIYHFFMYLILYVFICISK